MTFKSLIKFINIFSVKIKKKFFLQLHYEPVKDEKRILIHPLNNNVTVTNASNAKHSIETVIEEFSEPEDIMEGIRDVGMYHCIIL